MKFQVISTSQSNTASGPTVKVYGRSEDGNAVVHTVTGFKPYFYVRPKNIAIVKKLLSDMPEVTGIYEDYKFLPNGYQTDRIEVLQVYVNRPGDVPKLRDMLLSNPDVLGCYEADIIYATSRFLTDYDIYGMGWVEVENNNIIPINSRRDIAPIRCLGFDIEVCPPEEGIPVFERDPVTIISCSFNVPHNGQNSFVLVGKPGKNTENIKYCLDEYELLREFVNIVNNYNPDIIASFNGNNFDWPYLVGRYDKLSVPLAIGRNGMSAEVREFGSRKEANMVGRATIDLLEAIKANYSLSSYSLDNVSKVLLNRPKLDIKASEMRNIWLNGSEEELAEFVAYAMRDADLLQDIINELKLVDRYIAISQECGLLLHETINGGQSRRIESMLLRGFYSEGRLFPLKAKSCVREEKVEGATVFDIEPGFFEDGIVMDYKSLYPSVMRAYNICWSSILNEERPGVPSILAPNNVRYVDHSVYEGILPRILTNLYNKRVELKKLMKNAKDEATRNFYDNQQYAVKILLNSCYGYTGAVASRLYDPRLANSVTSAGRRAILMTKETAESLVKCRVLGGDTDSIFIQLLDEHTPEGGQKVAKIIHDVMLEKLPPPMEIDFECYFKSALLLRKKHYAMWIFEPDKDGWKDKMKYRGIELRRRDWIPLVGDVMEKVLELIMKENKISEAWKYTSDIIKKLDEMHDIRKDPEFAKKLILSRKIGNIRGYKNIQPHVTVYNKMAARGEQLPGLGDRIQYYALPGCEKKKISNNVDTVDYVLNTDGRIDNKWYIDHQLVPPLERIFRVLEIDMKTGEKIQKESSLFEFDVCEKHVDVVPMKKAKGGLFAFT